jgi:hypothetical protein
MRVITIKIQDEAGGRIESASIRKIIMDMLTKYWLKTVSIEIKEENA